MDILIEEREEGLWCLALKEGRIESLEVDPPYEEVRWGSIYWAKVESIDTSLDAAYLNLDGENVGILFNKDLMVPGPKGKGPVKNPKAISKTLKPGQMIAVQAKSAYLQKSSDLYLKPRAKNARMSTDITLPGRFLIFCANMKCNQISSRIRDKTMRKQLHKMMDQLDDMEGVILRSSAANTQTDMLRTEGRVLQEAWSQIEAYFKGDDPGLIVMGPDAIQRVLSDQAGAAIERIEVVTMDHFKMAEEWCQVYAPELVTKIDPIEVPDAKIDLALFNYRDLLGQIEDLFQPYIFLPSGGNIIIQHTAALTAIDVNRSSDRRANLAINLEAALEVARQMRLRNVGGTIMVDFINVKNKAEEGKIMKALEEAIKDDPCTVQLHGMTALGLMEISRMRRTPPLQDRFDGELF